MPFYKNARRLAIQMHQCDQDLYNIFAEHNKNPNLKTQLLQIKNYYHHSFNKTKDELKGKKVVEKYEQFLSLVKQVQAGEIKAEHAFRTLNEATEDRQTEIIVHNILKLCEILFWAAASAACYIACVSVGIPMLFCEPIFGLVVTLGSFVLFTNTIENTLDCFDEFKTFDSINEEKKREKNVISFFKTPVQQTTSKDKILEEQHQEQPVLSI